MLFSVPQTISIAVGRRNWSTLIDYRIEIVAMGVRCSPSASAYLLTRRDERVEKGSTRALALSEVPLRRNRDFILLWSGQVVSTLGSEVSGLAFPASSSCR